MFLIILGFFLFFLYSRMSREIIENVKGGKFVVVRGEYSLYLL